jgi:sensor c-di-GMP phosphodiesterase-like protein
LDTKRQRAKYAALLVLGGALGAGLALYAVRELQVRIAEEGLLRYAQTILRIEEKSAKEIRDAAAQLTNENLPFCSDEEIGAMRRLVYDARFIKDMGRVKDGYLYCTSGAGRLAARLPMPQPTFSIREQGGGERMDITRGTMLMLAPETSGIVLVSNGVSVVLNPAFYDQFDNPPMRATWLVRDPERNVVGYAFGQPEPLSSAEVVAGRLVESDGIIYQPQCSRVRIVCVVAAEAREDMLTDHTGYYVSFRVTAIVCSAAGALLGISMVSTILLVYHRERSFERRLRRAIGRREITCAYQPIVDLESGEIMAAEALARWTNELGEAVPSDLFIAVAEEQGFLGEITSLVMERVFADLAPVLHDEGFHVTINIATSDLRDARFFAQLEGHLERTGVAPATVGFEISEHSTALQEDAKAAINRLRAAGHLVYLDDFGTGYSSLAYLHDLHADAIKIDRAFTQTVGTDAVTSSVVPHILDMACRLGMKVIVEGIETAEQVAYFRAACAGVRGQGWLFGRPLAAGDFLVLVRGRVKLGANPGADSKQVTG